MNDPRNVSFHCSLSAAGPYDSGEFSNAKFGDPAKNPVVSKTDKTYSFCTQLPIPEEEGGRRDDFSEALPKLLISNSI